MIMTQEFSLAVNYFIYISKLFRIFKTTILDFFFKTFHYYAWSI